MHGIGAELLRFKEAMAANDGDRCRDHRLRAEPGERTEPLSRGDVEARVALGLFVSRDGRTLQLTPFDEEIPRAIYEELASLLLERLDSDR
jgi:hypothetical protein